MTCPVSHALSGEISQLAILAVSSGSRHRPAAPNTLAG
jgi:hypothetical protein